MKARNILILKCIFVLSLAVFIVFAVLVEINNVSLFDDILRYRVYATRTPAFTYFWKIVTYCGERQVVIAIGIILLAIKKTRINLGIPYSLAAIISTVIYGVAKLSFQRPRPDIALRLIEQGGYSFPSGHSMNCLVSYGILIYLIRKNCKNIFLKNVLTVFLTLLILFIGASRIYLGVHYPSDVIAGWSLGISTLITFIYLFERGKNGAKN